jgi:hypothetical protein
VLCFVFRATIFVLRRQIRVLVTVHQIFHESVNQKNQQSRDHPGLPTHFFEKFAKIFCARFFLAKQRFRKLYRIVLVRGILRKLIFDIYTLKVAKLHIYTLKTIKYRFRHKLSRNILFFFYNNCRFPNYL